MDEPIIVDTSVWIDFFNGKETENVKIFTHYLENDLPIFICPVIIQEILQGIASDKSFLKVKESLLALNVLDDDSIETAIGAAEIYRKLRSKGFTIRKSNDCMIAYYAIKYSLKVLHSDRDFDIIFENY